MSPNNVIRRSLQVCNVGLGQLALKATKLWLHDLCWRVCTIAIKGKKSWDRMSFLEELANSQGKEVANSQGDQAQSRRVNDQNLELICDIEEDRLNQYIRDGTAGLQAAQSQGGGFYKGIHVHSECSYFSGFLWGIKAS
eukprot:598970-Pelagomonas_calceolata.AAC.1